MAKEPEVKKSVKVFELKDPSLTNEEIATALKSRKTRVIVDTNTSGVFRESGSCLWVGARVDQAHFTVSLFYTDLHQAAKKIATCVGES